MHTDQHDKPARARPISPHLRKAIVKLEHHVRRVWRGYLTALEVIAMIEAGAVPEDARCEVEARAEVSAGEVRPSLRYFRVREGLEDLLQAAHPNQSRLRSGDAAPDDNAACSGQ